MFQVLGEGLLEEFPWQAQVPHQCTLPSGPQTFPTARSGGQTQGTIPGSLSSMCSVCVCDDAGTINQ